VRNAFRAAAENVRLRYPETDEESYSATWIRLIGSDIAQMRPHPSCCSRLGLSIDLCEPVAGCWATLPRARLFDPLQLSELLQYTVPISIATRRAGSISQRSHASLGSRSIRRCWPMNRWIGEGRLLALRRPRWRNGSCANWWFPAHHRILKAESSCSMTSDSISVWDGAEAVLAHDVSQKSQLGRRFCPFVSLPQYPALCVRS